MNIIQNITLDNFKKHKINNDDGFSLLELVTAVGVVLIFVMIALLSYQGLQGNAKQTAVNKAANEVYNKAYASLVDGTNKDTPKSIETEYNLSQGKKQDIIVLVKHPYGGDKNRIKVTAMMGDDYKAVKITPSSTSSNGSETGTETKAPIPVIDDDTLTNFTYKCDTQKSGYLPILNIGPDTKVYRWETGKKNETFEEIQYTAPDSTMMKDGDAFLRDETREEMARTQVLYETNFDWAKMYELVGGWDNKTHTQAQKDFYSVKNTVKNVSQSLPFKAGVEYSIMYDGDVETFAGPGNQPITRGGNNGIADCLTSITNLGNSTNLKNINYIGGKGLVDVPDNIPSTVINLRGAFENATNFNDPDIVNWDTSNVISLRSTFYNAPKFNQPIGVWDTSSLIVSHMTFTKAASFNQNVSHWDMSNARFISGAFQEATNFNNGCEKDDYSCPLTWNTDSVEDMGSIFNKAVSFNQQIGETLGNGYWNTSNAKSMVGVFVNASSYNNGCAVNETNCPLNLRTDNATGLNNFFLHSVNFNQNVSTKTVNGVEYWNTSSANVVTSVFYGATSFNNGSPAGESNSGNDLNWDLSSGASMENFFRDAKSFNQNTKSMILKNGIKKTNAHNGSGLKCGNIHPALLNTLQCKV